MKQQQKDKIYSLMEQFKFNPSNGNRYYEGVLDIIDSELSQAKAERTEEIEKDKQKWIEEGKRIERDSIIKVYRQFTGIVNNQFTAEIETSLSAETSLHLKESEKA